MKRKTVIKILMGTVVLAVLLFLLTLLFDALIEKKIRSALHEKNGKVQVDFDKVHVSIFKSGLALSAITIRTKPEYRNEGDLNGKIASIQCTGINLTKLLFKNDIDIHQVTISNITGVMPLSENSTPPMIASFNLTIHQLLFDKINLQMKSISSSKAYVVREGVLNIYDLHVSKKDTITAGIITQLDFKADELLSVSPDSMYEIIANGINYSSNTLIVNNFLIHPSYKDYDFTSRHKFQSDCIEADFKNISFHDFDAERYLKSHSLVSSYIGIGEMDLTAFRDRRKPLKHVLKPMFQELIYNYPGLIHIDSIGIVGGNATYTENAAKADRPGSISFNKINAKIYNIRNDTAFKTKKSFLEMNIHALLMGKGKLFIILKSQLYGPANTFSVDGTLDAMDGKALNPIVQRNAYINISSGTIDKMNFSFTANNTNATGSMTLLYHDLNIAVENKHTDATTGVKEEILSWIANIKILDSNPLPRKKVRTGMIAFERDREKFVFNYFVKAILSGIKSSIDKKSAKGKK